MSGNYQHILLKVHIEKFLQICDISILISDIFVYSSFTCYMTKTYTIFLFICFQHKISKHLYTEKQCII